MFFFFFVNSLGENRYGGHGDLETEKIIIETDNKWPGNLERLYRVTLVVSEVGRPNHRVILAYVVDVGNKPERPNLLAAPAVAPFGYL
jgi:hypothetical protein